MQHRILVMNEKFDTVLVWVIGVLLFVACVMYSNCPVFGDEWQFEVTHTQQVVVESEYYVVMFGAEWCGPCRTFEKNDLPKLKEVMPLSGKIDIDQQPKWKLPKSLKFKSGSKNHSGIRSLPTFWLIERSNDKSEVIAHEWVGNPGVQVILDRVRKRGYTTSVVDPDVILYEAGD